MKNIFALLLISNFFTNQIISQETSTSNDSLLKYLTDLKKEVQELKNAKTETNSTSTASITEKKSNWYDKIQIRGYVQVRYNRLFETNPDLKSDQGDRSIGNFGGFFY
jgi:hypothetical protein